MALTWNPSDKSTRITLSNGDLRAYKNSTGWGGVRASIGKSTGKWYFEVKSNVFDNYCSVGIEDSSHSLNSLVGNSISGWGYYSYNGNKYNNNSFSSYGNTWGNGDIIGCAVDFDTGKIWWSKNGVWQVSGNPATGANPTFSNVTGTCFPAFAAYYSSQGSWIETNAESATYPIPSGFEYWDFLIPSFSVEELEIQSTFISLNFSLDSFGDFSGPYDISFEYGLTTSYGSETTPFEITEMGEYSEEINNLVPETVYHYRAKVTDGTEIWYSDDSTFETPIFFSDIETVFSIRELKEYDHSLTFYLTILFLDDHQILTDIIFSSDSSILFHINEQIILDHQILTDIIFSSDSSILFEITETVFSDNSVLYAIAPVTSDHEIAFGIKGIVISDSLVYSNLSVLVLSEHEILTALSSSFDHEIAYKIINQIRKDNEVLFHLRSDVVKDSEILYHLLDKTVLIKDHKVLAPLSGTPVNAIINTISLSLEA